MSISIRTSVVGLLCLGWAYCYVQGGNVYLNGHWGEGTCGRLAGCFRWGWLCGWLPLPLVGVAGCDVCASWKDCGLDPKLWKDATCIEWPSVNGRPPLCCEAFIEAP